MTMALTESTGSLTNKLQALIRRTTINSTVVRGHAMDLHEALERIVCPECEHILSSHADKYGCELERGDRGGVALPPCGCTGGNHPDIHAAIEVLRTIRGDR